jgi:hypothetical protein
MSDYALRDREAIEAILRMLIGTSYRDPREGFGSSYMDELRGMRVPLQLSLARNRYVDGSVDDSDVSPEILQAYVTGELVSHERVAKAYIADLPRKLHGMARELRRFACFVAQGVMIGRPLNTRRINLICRMGGVNQRAFAIDVADALAWLYAQADAAAERYRKAAAEPRVKVA